MKAFVYEFCGKTILHLGAIPAVIAAHAAIIRELEIDVIHVELNKMEKL